MKTVRHALWERLTSQAIEAIDRASHSRDRDAAAESYAQAYLLAPRMPGPLHYFTERYRLCPDRAWVEGGNPP